MLVACSEDSTTPSGTTQADAGDLDAGDLDSGGLGTAGSGTAGSGTGGMQNDAGQNPGDSGTGGTTNLGDAMAPSDSGDSGDTGLGCEPGLVACDGECIDPLSNLGFCGASEACVSVLERGEACAAGSYCLAGACHTRVFIGTEDVGENDVDKPTPRHVRGGISNDGDALIVYRGGMNTNGGLYWVARDAGQSTFTSPSQLGATAIVAYEQFEVATCDDGPSVATWIESDGARDKEIAAVYTPGSGWTTPHVFYLGDDTANTGHSLGCTAESGPIMAWRNESGDDSRVVFSRYEGGEWTAPSPIDQGVNSDNGIRLSSAGGHIAVVFTELNATNGTDVVANVYSALSKTWSGPKVVAVGTAGNSFGEVRIAINSSGEAVLTYYDEDNDYAPFFLEYSSSTTSWATSEPLVTAESDLTAQGIAIAPNGDVQVFYQAYVVDQDVFLGFHRASGASTWTGDVPSAASGYSIMEHAKLFYDANNNLTFQWSSADGGDYRVDNARLSAGEVSWPAANNLEATTGVAIGNQQQDLWVSPNGRAISTWILSSSPAQVKTAIFE